MLHSTNACARLAVPQAKLRTGERTEKKRRVARERGRREKEPRLLVTGDNRGSSVKDLCS